MLAEVGIGSADTGAKIEDFRPGRIAGIGLQRRDVRDLVLRKILGRLAGDPDVDRVLRPVLVSKSIELCFVHNSSRVRVLGTTNAASQPSETSRKFHEK